MPLGFILGYVVRRLVIIIIIIIIIIIDCFTVKQISIHIGYNDKVH